MNREELLSVPRNFPDVELQLADEAWIYAHGISATYTLFNDENTKIVPPVSHLPGKISRRLFRHPPDRHFRGFSGAVGISETRNRNIVFIILCVVMIFLAFKFFIETAKNVYVGRIRR